ncbi:hypothetical protein [Methylobacterium sp. WL103]|uniref:hypothetical protein n=1 Tax=Methylobacterium sp. WL103 TaxID=2603891 RepID=UPI00164FA495|nr:hypothetical protein [Methylobacterium sp. WL103]
MKAKLKALLSVPLDDAQVHCDSDKPADVQGLTYGQGAEIHLGAGQEQQRMLRAAL